MYRLEAECGQVALNSAGACPGDCPHQCPHRRYVAHAARGRLVGMQDAMTLMILVLALVGLGIAACEFGADTRDPPDAWW